jgi:ribonuclease P protein component
LQRLKTRAQFQAVLAGSTVARSEHFALHRCGLSCTDTSVKDLDVVAGESNKDLNEISLRPLFPKMDLWLGAMVPKRWAKRAVTRNAIKRQIYTMSADFSPKLMPAAFVVRLRRDFSRKVYVSASSEALQQAVRVELAALMRRGES